jgi:hypothetical protein
MRTRVLARFPISRPKDATLRIEECVSDVGEVTQGWFIERPGKADEPIGHNAETAADCFKMRDENGWDL